MKYKIELRILPRIKIIEKKRWTRWKKIWSTEYEKSPRGKKIERMKSRQYSMRIFRV